MAEKFAGNVQCWSFCNARWPTSQTRLITSCNTILIWIKKCMCHIWTIIAKLRRAYPCGNVKANCNFVSHNGERKEIMWEWKRVQVIFKDVQMVQTLERKERTGRENRQTVIRVHNNITFRVWHVISFLSPLWDTKLQLDFTLPQG